MAVFLCQWSDRSTGHDEKRREDRREILNTVIEIYAGAFQIPPSDSNFTPTCPLPVLRLKTLGFTKFGSTKGRNMAIWKQSSLTGAEPFLQSYYPVEQRVAVPIPASPTY